MKLKVIACGVFERELRAVAAGSAHEVDVLLLDAGLHAAPDQLRLRAQEAVDAASSCGRYDAVCLTYGLCGRGTAGLAARDVPLVIPRVHDCIALFLGSGRAYAEQFARHPGTFYFTTGWYDHKAHPERTRLAAARRFDPETHPRFAELRERHGEQNARYVVEFLESWRRNYSRAALIDHGFATAEHQQATRAVAQAAGWRYERLEGSLALLEDLLGGRWDEERFLAVPPGHVVVPTNDERIVTAVEGEGSAADALRGETGVFTYGEPADSGPGGVGLGIDAGGTHTDAVLYDLDAGRLLDKAKALTTHHELVAGIREAIGRLSPAILRRAGYTCLSTTLATNAIVEGRGVPVGLILMPYHPGAARQVRTPLVRCVRGRINIEGIEEEPPEPQEVLRAADELATEGAAAFAVSGYGAVRNPKHELAVKALLAERYHGPVVCGHELTGRLNFVQRAHTAVLNARLLPIIADLLDSVARALGEAGVGGPLFVVRGDGSIMRRRAAEQRAIETVLSGPAASAAGGRLLTGRLDAVVVDMGGTTTDVALLEDGRPALSAEGARVGQWRTSVTAAEIHTTGLGGDSEVRPAGQGAVAVGPRRVVPLCVLAAEWPRVRDELNSLLQRRPSEPPAPAELEFFTLARDPGGLALDARERALVAALRERPHGRRALARACGSEEGLLPLGRLERVGVVRRAGVTPTDALHVLGEFAAYEAEAARLGLHLFGALIGCDAAEAASLVRREVERQLALAVMRGELAAERGPGAEPGPEALALLGRALEGGAGRPFRLRWEQRRPVVGIGAPIGAFLPAACRLLGAKALIPPHADVANAIGAVTSQVVARATARVRPGEFGGYVVFGPEGRGEFPDLETAQEAARREVVAHCRRSARRFGAAGGQVRVEVQRRVGRLQDGSVKLLELVVSGCESAPPAVAARSPSGEA